MGAALVTCNFDTWVTRKLLNNDVTMKHDSCIRCYLRYLYIAPSYKSMLCNWSVCDHKCEQSVSMITLRIEGSSGLLQGAWGSGLRKLTDVRMVECSGGGGAMVCVELQCQVTGTLTHTTARGIFGHLVKTNFPLLPPARTANSQIEYTEQRKDFTRPRHHYQQDPHTHFTMNDF